jgi:peptide/nickel transport system substrate-binding protein
VPAAAALSYREEIMTHTLPRRALLSMTASAIALAAGAPAAFAQQAGDRIRKIVLISWPQGQNPQAYQAGQLIAQEWRKLGLEIEIRSLPWQQHVQVVWNEREKWDMTMWRMVGRPERSDPDELVFNLYHSSTAAKGFNFIGYNNPAYDKIAEAQRQSTDQEKRRALVREAQILIDKDQAQAFLVHPTHVKAFNKAVWDEASIVNQSGIGLRNFWTFIRATPKGDVKQMVLNAAEPVLAINPLFIAGGTSSWTTELIWDRLARVGPDGLPQDWAAEKLAWVNETTIDATIRVGMTWHDGKPVTTDDVIYSFEAPGIENKVPMYKPFVADIAKMEKTGERTVRFTLKRPNAAFVTASLAKINLIPKHIWEPVMKDLLGKPENAEALANPSPVGSGPFKLVRARGNEEVVLDRYDKHFSPPKMERWVLRIVTNPEAILGMLRRGEINFLADYGGDTEVLEKMAKETPNIVVKAEVDIGFEYTAFNLRRAPFNDPNFRRALSLAIDRNVMVQAAWNGYAVAANSHVSPALKFWHASEVDGMKTGFQMAKDLLEKSGYRMVGGQLHYPSGVKETLTAN